MGVVLELLECGADPNQADKVRRIYCLQCQYVRWLMILSLQDCALCWASDNGHDEIVRVLLVAKATVNTQIKVGFVVQTHFPQHAVYIVFLLCTVGSNPSLGSQFRRSPEKYGASNRCWGQC